MQLVKLNWKLQLGMVFGVIALLIVAVGSVSGLLSSLMLGAVPGFLALVLLAVGFIELNEEVKEGKGKKKR